MKIKVGKNYICEIDDEDFEKVKNINWRVIKSSNSDKPYAYHPDYGMMHRFIMDTPANLQCDHKNLDTLNNKKENLRNCTISQNLMNRPKYIGKSSQFKGVSWYPNQKKWRARINLEGRTILLGYFESELDAAKAYNEKAFELYGEFAVMNYVQSHLQHQGRQRR